MITYCPHCHTHFRIQPEQLSARAGRVRCGKCSRVFDASEHLIEETVPADETLAEQPRAAAGSGAEPPMVPTSAPEPTPAEPQQIGAQEWAPANAGGMQEGDPAMQAGAGESEAAAPAAAPPLDAETEEAAAGTNPFDFGPQTPQDAATRRRRWPWLVGSLLLLLALLAQAAYFYRSGLVILFPQAKPYAAELCASLGCDLPLPRRIELMSIEASDLQADTANPNIMVLSATLKNRAVFNQQLPLLELTLTDVQDQPVVRRVLAPQDYAGKAADAQTGFGANTEIAIKVFIEASQVKATGYRLYLFYP